MPSTGHAVILGGGPAGLAAGHALSRAGWSVDVYEQGASVGGLARTIERDGFRFDIGGHRWFTKKQELNLFLTELLSGELVLVNRTSRILFQGKSVDYPLRLANALASIGPVNAVRAAGDLWQMWRANVADSSPARSMEDAYVSQYGPTLYELFFRRYSEKVWGRPCSELSGDWVEQRTRGLSLDTAVRHAFGRSGDGTASLVDRFMYPGLGYGRISERMAEEICADGGAVHLGWRVVGVRYDAARHRLTEVVVSDGAGERTIGGNAFVSSIPMPELVRILQPKADPSAVEASASLTYRHLVTAHLLIDRPRVTSDTWIYVHEPDVSFARLHEPRNWSAEMAPEGMTSLVLELFCDADDEIWARSDEGILDQVGNELVHRLHLLDPGDIVGGFVVRSRDAYPRYGLGYRDAVGEVRRYLDSFANLSVVGRGGTFQYNNTDHAIESGFLAARRILGEAADPWAVNGESAYLEQGLAQPLVGGA